MKLDVNLVTARSLVIELEETDCYQTREYDIYINNVLYGSSNKVVDTIYGLKPNTEYTIYIKRDGIQSDTLKIHTDFEYVTLNVRDFGAKGDGIADDTKSIQAAILCCPLQSRVYIPEGIYKITNLFLKSNIILELGKNSVLSGITDKSQIPVLPGRIENYDEDSEYLIASWEGNPLASYASLITGIHVENVVICGEGTVDGGGDFTTWWNSNKDKDPYARPRMLFLNKCNNITLQGITVKNSPAWNLHPYFSKNLKFMDLKILSPSKSHNTDGIDPESCENVEIIGVYFSVGDDCIAIKSGKIYMGRKYKTPSKNITIQHCHMEKGHGAVTIGSEIGAGVSNIVVKNCSFSHTDRGLRIKTRRGRGEDSVLKDIVFEDIKMDHVRTPLVVNSFYYCDPDGKTNYVSSKESLPVDDRTPSVKNLTFRNMVCTNCHIAAAYFYGLPEKKIEMIEMENIHFTYAKDAIQGIAAMMIGCDVSVKKSLFARNINQLILRNVVVEGNIGETFDTRSIDNIEIVK